MMDNTLLTAADEQIREFTDVSDELKSEYASYLRELSPASQKLAATWLTTGTTPQAEHNGMTLERLMRMMAPHPLVAIIMLDRLEKNPDAYRPLIQLRDGELRFNLRDAPAGFEPTRPAISPLTEALAESVSDFLLTERIDPPELRLTGSGPTRLGVVVAGLGSVQDAEELAEAVEDLRRMCAAAGEIPDEPAEPLSEVQRIGLVLRLLADLAADDLSRLTAVDSDGLAGDPSGAGLAEQPDCAGHVGGSAEAAER
jgi:hypothetical protein